MEILIFLFVIVCVIITGLYQFVWMIHKAASGEKERKDNINHGDDGGDIYTRCESSNNNRKN